MTGPDRAADQKRMSATSGTSRIQLARWHRETANAPVGSRGDLEPKRTSTTLSVIVPAYNERFLIEASLARLLVLGESALLDTIKVIVVDDASSDGTAEAIRSFRASLASKPHRKFTWVWLRHARNGGKGAAIRTGLAEVDTELVVIHDADLEYHPSDLLRMVEVFLFEEADAVFGSRFMAGGYKRALFFRHAIGNKLLTFLCDVVCDLNLTDMETCYKMVRANLLKSIPLESSTFDVEPELAEEGYQFGQLVSRLQSARIGEQPHHRPREPFILTTHGGAGPGECGAVGAHAEKGDRSGPEGADLCFQLPRPPTKLVGGEFVRARGSPLHQVGDPDAE